MKKRVMGKLTAFLLVAVMCVSLCIDFTTNAINSGTTQQEKQVGETEQIEQTEQVKQESGVEKILTEEDTGISEDTEELTGQKEENLKAQELSEQSVGITETKEPMLLSDFNLSNPRIEKDSYMTAGQKVTWDCVCFGSYPQAEVIPSANDYTAVDKNMLRSGDIIEDSSLYNKLQNITGWNSNNDITENGNKYRRIKKNDATFTNSGSGWYNWSDSDTYHYFKYEPIRWRVLNVNQDEVFLLSDIVLDYQRYNAVSENITWATSTIRSWLNGHDSSSKNFIDSAFSSDEKSALKNIFEIDTEIVVRGAEKDDNLAGDQIFFLSEMQISGDNAKAYGFISSQDICDEARRSKSSTYAKAMGIMSSTSDEYKGNCFWWSRTSGSSSDSVIDIRADGSVYIGGDDVYYGNIGMRVALYLDLSSNLHTYAGTVKSNDEKKAPVTENNNLSNKPTGNPRMEKKNQSINTSASSYTKAIGSKVFSLGAKAGGDGKLTYTSSNKKVATVSSAGQVSVKSYGTATITINALATQNYNAATKKVSIKVVPKKGTLKAVKSPSKKKMKISWKKDKTVTGYEIYVSPKKDFSRETIKRNYKKNTVSKTISGWKRKRTYYVKIRGYKKIGKSKYYGAWSNVKKVKVK